MRSVIVTPKDKGSAPLNDNFNNQISTEDFTLNSLLGRVDGFLTSPRQRVQDAQDWLRQYSDRPIALSSSFGLQSVVMIRELLAAKCDVAVVSVNIPGKKYDLQREYRAALQRELGFELHVFEAESEGDKVQAMDRGLQELNVGMLITGLRQEQTKNRQGKNFVGWNDRNKTIELHPIFNWNSERVDGYVKKMPEKLRHPQYQPGVKMTGGAIVTEKTECGLHEMDDVAGADENLTKLGFIL